MDARFLWTRQKRVQGFTLRTWNRHRRQTSWSLTAGLTLACRKLAWAHEKMLDNRHLPGNMAVLVNSPKPGLRTVEDVLEVGSLS